MGGGVADCGLESLEALQACNGLWEGVLLYNCEGEEGIFVIITDVYLFSQTSTPCKVFYKHDELGLA